MIRIFFFIFLIGSAALSENDEPSNTSQHGIGIAAGGISSVGITYRGFFSSGLGLQTTFGAFGTSRYFDMFGGLQILYKFHRSSSRVSYYVLAGSAVILESFSRWTLVPGAGVGMEIAIYKGLTAALDISLAPIIPLGRKPTVLGYIPLPFPGFTLVYYF